MSQISETLLHFIWKHKLYSPQGLQTTDGRDVIVLDHGRYNIHAGPDFTEARLRIGETIWAGSVEMHLLASDWIRHQHQHDPNYENVILHVVWEDDLPVPDPSGVPLPVIRLRDWTPAGIIQQYRNLQGGPAIIPCKPILNDKAAQQWPFWRERLLIERMESKTASIREIFAETGNNWEETYYRLIARQFGLHTNTDAFEQLARSLPQRLIAKHRTDSLQTEALLFGQAGMLHRELTDEWPLKLHKEYMHLKAKYKLKPMPGGRFKFLRMRPVSFPTVRIAQLASLIINSDHLFRRTIDAVNIQEIESLFTVSPSPYWLDHYRFDTESKPISKSIGQDHIALIVINAIAPILFFYGRTIDDDRFAEKALAFLEAVAPEKNHLLAAWHDVHFMSPTCAAHTQALLQLRSQYCDSRRCLECGIGSALIRS